MLKIWTIKANTLPKLKLFYDVDAKFSLDVNQQGELSKFVKPFTRTGNDAFVQWTPAIMRCQ